MNPIVQFVLTQVFGVIESLIATEGSTVLAWIEAELAALQKKYGGTPPTPPAPPAA